MQIEIWSDFICPWCYIGKRRFEKALTQTEHRDTIEIVWRSFELDPAAPTHLTESLTAMLARKYGVSAQQAQAMNAQVSQLAALEGLNYRLDVARPGNTLSAHQLMHLAHRSGKGAAVTERLMRGYFSESLPIGDTAALVDAVADCGIARDDAKQTVDENRYADAVRADEQRAARLGIRGVPFFLIDEKIGISGAQPVEKFVEALRAAR